MLSKRIRMIVGTTIVELAHDTQKSRNIEKNRAALEQFLLPPEIIDVDIAAAQVYSAIRAQLETKGTLIASLDLLIAAQALRLGISLITNNEKSSSVSLNSLLKPGFRLAMSLWAIL